MSTSASDIAWLLLAAFVFIGVHIIAHTPTEQPAQPLSAPSWGTDTSLLRELRAERKQHAAVHTEHYND